MQHFIDGLRDLSLIAIVTILLANLGFMLLRPFVGRLTALREYEGGVHSADMMLVVFPLLMLTAGFLGYAVVSWVLPL
ncbi:MAG TPA: hypothetical protein VMU85_12265 [Stellaceae bacterium]|nr:hypothetical protein [Stellaceae bacterium]